LPQHLNLEACRFDTPPEFQSIRCSVAVEIEVAEEAVGLVECIRHFRKPARPMGRRHFGWYAEHRRPL
jgi:hypothetical protein